MKGDSMRGLMSSKRLGCLLLLATMVSGCKRIEVSELYGTYVAKHTFGVQKLSLNPNGEYIQEVSIEGASEVVTNRGKWRYNSTNQYVTLENALVVTDGFGKLNKDYRVPFSGSVVTPAGRLSPWSRITIGSCEGTLYVKQQ